MLMLRYKITIGVLAALVAGLAVALILALQSDQAARTYEKDFILYNMDKLDVARLDEMVQRHSEGKGDYLMLIPPIIDGGYWIYDVHSNGSIIQWTIDNSRDGMSSNPGKMTYSCREISKQERVENYGGEKSTFFDYKLNGCAEPEQDGAIVFTVGEKWR
jgi:hypothetical protein